MDLMTKQAVVEDLNVSERTLEKWVRDGKFPTPGVDPFQWTVGDLGS